MSGPRCERVSAGLPRRIETARLVLRVWSPERDAAAARAALDASDAHLRPWIPVMRHEPRTLRETQTWLESHLAQFDDGEAFRYAIFDRDEAALLGEAMLLRRGPPRVLELGYWIHVDHTRRGYALEASRALIELGLAQPDTDLLEIVCAADNGPSNAIPPKLGFARDPARSEALAREEGGGVWSVWVRAATEAT